MSITIDGQWRVNAREMMEVPFPAAAIWRCMQDPARFLASDPLHRVVVIDEAHLTRSAIGPRSYRGARVLLKHRLFGIGPDRVGRILTWDHGKGYVVSDLSRRGVRVGFPHVCEYRVEPIDPTRSRIIIGARGKWTATWMPRVVVKCWLGWVLKSTRAMVLLDVVTDQTAR